MTTVQGTSQISPADERVYHQSNLLGDWKGAWTKTNQAVEFKVINIRGGKAQVEYTHNGRTERGFGAVDQNTITFDNVTIATRNGQRAVMVFDAGGTTMTAALDKQASTADQSKLIGTWTGFSRENGQVATFQVLSVSGRDAQVKATVNGHSQQGTGTVYKNTVMFGSAQISSDDGKTGKVVMQVRHQTYAVPVTNYGSSGSSSAVNKLA
jgi:hypothetical protein